MSSVSSSLARHTSSPVSVSTRSLASTLPSRYSTGTSSFLMLAFSIWRTWRTVMRLPDLDDHLAPVADLKRCDLAPQALGNQVQDKAVVGDVHRVGIEEDGEDLLAAEAERAQQDGSRELAPAVDSNEQAVLVIELEVQPGTAVGNHPGRVQQLARGMRLALVVVEEHAWGAVQLGDDDALRAVDDKGAGVGHQRQLAHVDFLLLDVLDLLGIGRGLLVVDHQAQQDLQRRMVGEAPELAFLDLERRRLEAVADVLQLDVARVADDGKDRLEHAVQAGSPRVSRPGGHPAESAGTRRAGSAAGKVRSGFPVACRNPCGFVSC